MKNVMTLVSAIDCKFQEIDAAIKELHLEIQKLDGEDYLNLRRETCDMPRIHMKHYLNVLKGELDKLKSRQS
jgi:hypothetical protein